MTCKDSSFMSGVHYLSRQQRMGMSNVGNQLINRRFEHSAHLYSKDLYSHYGCVNAIEFSNDGEWLVSGGDDKRVLLWNIDKTLSGSYCPTGMKAEHNSNIFCLSFNASRTKLLSAGNDEQVILHDVCTGETSDVFLHEEAVYGLSVDPVNENVFASACDDGRVSVYDVRESSRDAHILCSSTHSFHAVMYNPIESRLIATANAKEGVGLWDIRKPRACLLKYGELANQGAMNIRFNATGTNILALRRRLPLVLYDISSSRTVAEFDHQEYYNSCTMKSCCFAGNRDQFVISGSDDFKLYIWKVPEGLSTHKKMCVTTTQRIVRGHRSIVNQVRYNSVYGMLASSGVEKIIKLWSTFPMLQKDCIDHYVSSNDGLRKVYSHAEYINLVLDSGQFMTHDYSHHSVQEDPRMMAFFDSLVQRDIEGWASDSSAASTPCFEVQSSSSTSTSVSSSSSGEEDSSSRWSLPVTEFVLPDGRLTPHVMMCLTSLRRRGILVQDHPDKGSANEENVTCSSDKISQLIAQKRRDHMSKLNKKKIKSERKSSALTNGTVKCDSSVNQMSAAVQAKDKRKLLCKKRAKLDRNFGYSDSSDSDCEAKQSSRVKEENFVEFSETVQGQSVGDILEKSPQVSNDVDQAESVQCEFIEDRSEAALTAQRFHEAVQLPRNAQLSENTLSNDVAVDKSGSLRPSIFFQPINGKRNRNYRKRSAEED